MKKIHRFVNGFPLLGTRAVLTDPELVHQIYHVLKLRPGENIILSDGKGNDSLVEIISRDDASCYVKIVGRESLQSGSRVILYCAVLKKKNFEWAAEKGVETGAAEIVPLITERTVKTGIKAERLQSIIREAAEQSGNAFVAEARGAKGLAEALAESSKNAINWFLDPSGEDFLTAIRDWRETEEEKNKMVGVWIGPEGGWTDDELAAGKAAGCRVVSLGRLILRAETAAAVAVYLAAR
jgi:16S rRNA (uracil1498-N3)-methyltransferase